MFDAAATFVARADAILDPLYRAVWDALCAEHGPETANRYYCQVRWLLRDDECRDPVAVLHWHGVYDATIAKYGSQL